MRERDRDRVRDTRRAEPLDATLKPPMNGALANAGAISDLLHGKTDREIADRLQLRLGG